MIMKPYKGYSARVDIDVLAGLLVGRLLDIDDVVMFQADRAADLEQEFHTSVDVYLEVCTEQGKQPSKPHSGKFVVRTSPNLHAQILRAAQAEGKSMNSWIEDTLAAVAAKASP
jgi:predicted HicB family RNase H-like nuclease